MDTTTILNWSIITFPSEKNLVGGIPTPLKNVKVSWDDDIPNMMGKS